MKVDCGLASSHFTHCYMLLIWTRTQRSTISHPPKSDRVDAGLILAQPGFSDGSEQQTDDRQLVFSSTQWAFSASFSLSSHTDHAGIIHELHYRLGIVERNDLYHKSHWRAVKLVSKVLFCFVVLLIHIRNVNHLLNQIFSGRIYKTVFKIKEILYVLDLHRSAFHIKGFNHAEIVSNILWQHVLYRTTDTPPASWSMHASY